MDIYFFFCFGRNLESCPLQDGGAEDVSLLIWRGSVTCHVTCCALPRPSLRKGNVPAVCGWIQVLQVLTCSDRPESLFVCLFVYHKVLLLYLNIRGLMIVCGRLIILKKINMNLGICISLFLLLCGLSSTWAQTNISKMIHISISFFIFFYYMI